MTATLDFYKELIGKRMSLLIKKKAEELISPIIEKEGYEVVEVACDVKYGELNLTFYIYKKGGVTFEDCEKVNALLDEPLEALDITGGAPYNLNISSPGLDRPIISEKDFERALDTEIEIIFVKPEGKKKKTNGVLLAYDENSVTLSEKNVQKMIEKSKIFKIQPYIKF